MMHEKFVMLLVHLRFVREMTIKPNNKGQNKWYDGARPKKIFWIHNSYMSGITEYIIFNIHIIFYKDVMHIMRILILSIFYYLYFIHGMILIIHIII